MENGVKTTVFISYNPVDGFCSGWHADDKVFVCANDSGPGAAVGEGKNDEARAGSVMHKLSGQYNGVVPVERVKRYYVYAGLYAFRQAIGMAKSLAARSSAPVTVVSCDCEPKEKCELLYGTSIDLVSCECGGRETMGRLAAEATTSSP